MAGFVPSSDYDSFPDCTVWVPCAPADIPCILIPYRNADSLMVFAHGNGCDIGSMYETFQYYKNHFRCNVLLFEVSSRARSRRRGDATALLFELEASLDRLQPNPLTELC